MKKNLLIILGVVVIVAVGYLLIANSNRSSIVPQTSADVYIGGNDVLGSFLIAPDGMTLYTFANDTSSQSTCVGECALRWPPYIIETLPVAGEGIEGSIGAFGRDDGSLQMTYNGKPLYFWVEDVKPGDAKGHGVNNLWFVALP